MDLRLHFPFKFKIVESQFSAKALLKICKTHKNELRSDYDQSQTRGELLRPRVGSTWEGGAMGRGNWDWSSWDMVNCWMEVLRIWE